MGFKDLKAFNLVLFTKLYKVNVYGPNFANLGCCGARVVIRNKESLIMGAMSKKIPCPLSATEVEAMALEEGIQLA